MQVKDKEIRELFELSMKVALNTDHVITFEFSTAGELSVLYLCDVKGGVPVKHFPIYLYEPMSDYGKAKKFLERILDEEVQE